MKTDLPVIYCEQCGKRVDQVLMHRREDFRGVVIAVRCHGEREEMKVYDADLADKGYADALQRASQDGSATAFKTEPHKLA